MDDTVDSYSAKFWQGKTLIDEWSMHEILTNKIQWQINRSISYIGETLRETGRYVGQFFEESPFIRQIRHNIDFSTVNYLH